MIRSALLLCAALLAATCFACVAPPGSAPVPRARQPFWLASADQLHTYDALTACSDGTDPTPFVNKAYTLSDGYFPSTAGPGTYSPPSPIGVQVASTDSLSQVASDLRAAYCMASRTFKKQLDQITNVFITCDLNNCTPSQNSSFFTTWGYRENPTNQSTLQQTFISLSINLWNNSGKLQPYSSFEMSIYSNLLPNQDPLIAVNASDAQGSDHTEWTILAALAHELGHIYWWKLDAANYACADDTGDTTKFWEYSWKRQARPIQFHQFGQQQAPSGSGFGGSIPSNSHKQKDEVKKDYGNGDNPHKVKASADLSEIYSNGLWASLFSTVTPDEDFVETYKLWALTDAGLSTLKVTVSGQAAYLVNPTNPVGFWADGQSDLYLKSQWIKRCFQWPS